MSTLLVLAWFSLWSWKLAIVSALLQRREDETGNQTATEGFWCLTWSKFQRNATGKLLFMRIECWRGLWLVFGRKWDNILNLLAWKSNSGGGAKSKFSDRGVSKKGPQWTISGSVDPTTSKDFWGKITVFFTNFSLKI